MRKLVLAVLMFSAISYGQLGEKKDAYLSLSSGVDIRNAICGSNPVGNKGAYDGIFQFNIVGANVEMNLGFETFEKNHYTREFIGLGYHFPLYAYPFDAEIKTTFIPSLEANCINRDITETYTLDSDPTRTKRYDTKNVPFFTMGLNFAFQWDLTNNFAIQLATKVCPRPDIQYMYGTNKTEIANYFKIVYKFNKN